MSNSYIYKSSFHEVREDIVVDSIYEGNDSIAEEIKTENIFNFILSPDYISYITESPDAQFSNDNNFSNKKANLWYAIIVQAFLDATNSSKRTEEKLAKIDAIKWLSGNSKDFIFICNMADLDADYVRKKAEYALNNTNLWKVGIYKNFYS